MRKGAPRPDVVHGGGIPQKLCKQLSKKVEGSSKGGDATASPPVRKKLDHVVTTGVAEKATPSCRELKA